MGYPGWYLGYLPSTPRESGADGFDHSVCRCRFCASIAKVYRHFLWSGRQVMVPQAETSVPRVLQSIV